VISFCLVHCKVLLFLLFCFFFFQAEDGIRDDLVTGVQTCALPISSTMEPGCQAGEVSRSTAPSSRVRSRVPSGCSPGPLCSRTRSEERRVGKECRSRGGWEH